MDSLLVLGTRAQTGPFQEPRGAQQNPPALGPLSGHFALCFKQPCCHQPHSGSRPWGQVSRHGLHPAPHFPLTNALGLSHCSHHMSREETEVWWHLIICQGHIEPTKVRHSSPRATASGVFLWTQPCHAGAPGSHGVPAGDSRGARERARAAPCTAAATKPEIPLLGLRGSRRVTEARPK